MIRVLRPTSTDYAAARAGTIVEALRDGLAARADPAAAPAMQAYMKSAMPFLGVAKPARGRLLRAALAAVRAAAGSGRRRAAVGRRAGPRGALRRHALVGRHARLADRLGRSCGSGSSRAPGGTTSTRSRPGWSAPRCAPTPTADSPSSPAGRRTGPLATPNGGDLPARSGAATDLALLTGAIEANVDDPDFFLRKGIGWALRQHARTDPEWVREFVESHPRLSPLSRKEALKHLPS